MNLKPLGDRLVIQPSEQEEQTSTGLFLPETAKEKPQQGKVIAAGPAPVKIGGDRIPLDVKVGDPYSMPNILAPRSSSTAKNF